MKCKMCGSAITEANLTIYGGPVCSPVCKGRYRMWKHNKNSARKVKEARREHNRRMLEIQANRPVDTSTRVLMQKGEILDPEGLKESLKRKPLAPPPVELTPVQRSTNGKLIKFEMTYLGKEAVFCSKSGSDTPSRISHVNKSMYRNPHPIF